MPHDTDRVAAVIHRALLMSKQEQRTRMEVMRSYIRTHDVFHWVRSFEVDDRRMAPFEPSQSIAMATVLSPQQR